ELAAADALPHGDSWEVLDLGAGPGVTSLALVDWLCARGLRPRLRVTAIDRDGAALALAQAVHAQYRADVPEAPAVEDRALRADLTRTPLPAGAFDLVLCANVLCELWRPEAERIARRARLLESVGDRLAPAGAIAVIEPALREVARDLHAV